MTVLLEYLLSLYNSLFFRGAPPLQLCLIGAYVFDKVISYKINMMRCFHTCNRALTAITSMHAALYLLTILSSKNVLYKAAVQIECHRFYTIYWQN